MRHILIGGQGFLGRELARQILQRPGDSAVVVDLEEAFAAHPPQPDPRLSHVTADATLPHGLDAVPIAAEDTVHHLASRLIVPNRPRFGRDAYFRACAVDGTREVLRRMAAAGASRMVFWSTDMVYGPALQIPRPESHPRRPFGPYGRSKVAAEDLLEPLRRDGRLNCTIFRPRLILGPGRLGILEVLFKLIDRGWPVPLIGAGTNRFQFVSVADCARASLLAADRGCPNGTYNLGSAGSPQVHELMQEFIARSGSRSRLLRTPGGAVKAVLRLLNALKVSPMDPEQFEIADLEVSLDIAAAERDLGWRPSETDTDLLCAAYDSYRAAQGCPAAEAQP
ncbi:NAD-dependent epimerase/dehydratase family protein (plasmid) [Roseobacteraceae bacterium NS-SX3]